MMILREQKLADTIDSVYVETDSQSMLARVIIDAANLSGVEPQALYNTLKRFYEKEITDDTKI